MKKNIYRMMFAAAAVLLAAACEETPAPFETEVPKRPITAPVKSATAYYEEVAFAGEIDSKAHTITFQFDKEGVDFSAIRVKLDIISRATPSTGCFKDSTLNLNEPYSFAVNNLETDIIYTIYAKRPSFVEVDRTLLSAIYGRAGDAPVQTDNGYGVTFTKEELFDGTWMSGYQVFSDVLYHYFGWLASTPNRWFTFQCKEAFRMAKAKIYPYWGWRNFDPALFEIWAYTPAGDLPESTPGDWQTAGKWKKIADVDISSLWEQVKANVLGDDGKTPNNDVVGTEDDPCADGYEFQISDYCDDIPTAKYYRFVQKENFYGIYKAELDQYWNQRVAGVTISELRIWKYAE